MDPTRKCGVLEGFLFLFLCTHERVGVNKVWNCADSVASKLETETTIGSATVDYGNMFCVPQTM